VSTAALGLAQPPIQCVPGAVSPGVKRPRSKDYYSSPPSVEDKDGGAVPPLQGQLCLHLYLRNLVRGYRFYSSLTAQGLMPGTSYSRGKLQKNISLYILT
jgi:hypothetical protein